MAKLFENALLRGVAHMYMYMNMKKAVNNLRSSMNF